MMVKISGISQLGGEYYQPAKLCFFEGKCCGSTRISGPLSSCQRTRPSEKSGIPFTSICVQVQTSICSAHFECLLIHSQPIRLLDFIQLYYNVLYDPFVSLLPSLLPFTTPPSLQSHPYCCYSAPPPCLKPLRLLTITILRQAHNIVYGAIKCELKHYGRKVLFVSCREQRQG